MSPYLLDASLGALNARTVGALVLIGVAPLLLVAMFVLRHADGTPQKASGIGALVLAGMLLALGLLQLSVLRLQLDTSSLMVGGGLYSKRVAIADIDLSSAASGNLAQLDHALESRINGIGMPGLALGWFRTSQGKVFAVITDPEVLVLPTRQGYTLIFSTPDAEAILLRLRQLQRGQGPAGEGL